MNKAGSERAVEFNLTQGQRESLLRKAWYSHDARWFSAVAGEFGMEAANQLNRRVMRSVGQIEVRRLAKETGMETPESLTDFLEFLEAGREFYVTDDALEMSIEQIDDRQYSVSVGTCFVSENIWQAGIADTYECAVFDRLQGWHDALGLLLAEETLPVFKCPRAAGEACTRTLTLRGAANPG